VRRASGPGVPLTASSPQQAHLFQPEQVEVHLVPLEHLLVVADPPAALRVGLTPRRLPLVEVARPVAGHEVVEVCPRPGVSDPLAGRRGRGVTANHTTARRRPTTPDGCVCRSRLPLARAAR
jgi:hypothetical protein